MYCSPDYTKIWKCYIITNMRLHIFSYIWTRENLVLENVGPWKLPFLAGNSFKLSVLFGSKAAWMFCSTPPWAMVTPESNFGFLVVSKRFPPIPVLHPLDTPRQLQDIPDRQRKHAQHNFLCWEVYEFYQRGIEDQLGLNETSLSPLLVPVTIATARHFLSKRSVLDEIPES